MVTGAGDLPGGGPRGHAPAALSCLLGVSVEQSWTRTRSAGPRSASDSPGSYIPTHPQPRDSARRLLQAQSRAGDIAPASRAPRPCPPFSPATPPLTAQLVSDAARELLGHLTPGSCCNRQAEKSESEREQMGDERNVGPSEPGLSVRASTSGASTGERLCFQQVGEPEGIRRRCQPSPCSAPERRHPTQRPFALVRQVLGFPDPPCPHPDCLS